MASKFRTGETEGEKEDQDLDERILVWEERDVVEVPIGAGQMSTPERVGQEEGR